MNPEFHSRIQIIVSDCATLTVREALTVEPVAHLSRFAIAGGGVPQNASPSWPSKFPFRELFARAERAGGEVRAGGPRPPATHGLFVTVQKRDIAHSVPVEPADAGRLTILFQRSQRLSDWPFRI